MSWASIELEEKEEAEKTARASSDPELVVDE